MQKKDIYCYDLNKFFLEKRSKYKKNSIHENNIYKPTKKVLIDKSHKIKIKIHPELQGIYYCFEELFKSCYQDLSFFFHQPIELNIWKIRYRNSFLCTSDLLKFIYINKNNCNAEFSIHLIEEFELDFLTLKILSGHEFITFISSFDFELKKIDLKKILFLINRYIPKECIKPLNIRELKYESEIMGLDLLAILLRNTKDDLLNQYYQT